MKRFLLIFLGVVTLMGIPFSVSAKDVKDSIADYYDHAETGISIPYRLVLPEVYDEKFKKNILFSFGKSIFHCFKKVFTCCIILSIAVIKRKTTDIVQPMELFENFTWCNDSISAI